MPQTNNPQEFTERAKENQLEISVQHAEEIGDFAAIVSAAYSTIRDIDTTGFEPSNIFVPTSSKRESK
jgi:hypothetical protein